MQKLRKWMSKFIHGLREVLAGFMILRKRDRSIAEKELSKLLDFETLQARTFYKIQREINEIKKSQEKLVTLKQEEVEEKVVILTQKWQKAMSLLGKASPEAQQQRWREIIEQYYKEIDEESFEAFVKKQKKDIAWGCKLTKMQVGLNLASIGAQKGFEILESVGIKGKDFREVTQRVKAQITNRELKESKEVKDDVVAADFYSLWAKVRKAGYQIDEDIKLPGWVGILKDIKEDNARSNT